MDGAASLNTSSVDMTDGELYEHDFPAWCDLQAERLRAVASRASGQDQPDWTHVIEEIADMGAAERRQVERLLIQAMVHLMKLQMAPTDLDVPHWIIEIRAFLGDAGRAFAPSMRRALDVDGLYQTAVFRLTGRRSGAICPFTLDELIGRFPDVPALAAKLPPFPAA
jgi:hypothetical protein